MLASFGIFSAAEEYSFVVFTILGIVSGNIIILGIIGE